jgi:hypothetical protein
MSNKQAKGFAAIPILLVLVAAAIALLFVKEQLKPVPVTPPMYKVGECGKNTVNPDSDGRTETDSTFKIVAMGKKNYEYLLGQIDGKKMYVKLVRQPIDQLDPGTEKVPCPKELDDPKTLEKARGKE